MRILIEGLPPGPRLKWLSDLRYYRDPTTFHRDCRREFGDTFTVRGTEGAVVITTEPDLAAQIYAASHDQLGAPVDLTEPAIGERSLFHMKGTEARDVRKQVSAPIGLSQLGRYTEMICSATERHAGTWSNDRPVLLRRAMNDLSKEIIIRTVIGTEARTRIDRCADLITRYVASFFAPALFYPALRSNVFPQWRRFVRARAAFRQHLHEEIEHVRATGDSDSGILSWLLTARFESGRSMDKDEIVDQLVTLLLAGHETTSVGITWALYWLEREPDVLARALDELASVTSWRDEPMSLTWLGALCSEAVRIYPITSRITRKVVNQSFRLGDWNVPVGLGVGISITAIHKSPKIYPEPLRFRPQRFLERKFAPHEYMPFGGGIRRCVGAAFAEWQTRLVVAELISRFKFKAVSRNPAKPIRRNVIVAPEGDVPMWLSARA